MSTESDHLNIDVSAEHARALHRIVRAMHDGHCPQCGYLGSAEAFTNTFFHVSGSGGGHQCPQCRFATTADEERAALKAFAPYLHRSLEVFELWRKGWDTTDLDQKNQPVDIAINFEEAPAGTDTDESRQAVIDYLEYWQRLSDDALKVFVRNHKRGGSIPDKERETAYRLAVAVLARPGAH